MSNDPDKPFRLLSGSAAAAYWGVTPPTFSKWVAAGTVPAALPGTRRWDRKAIDLALDKASRIAVSAPLPDGNAELEQWIRDDAARRAEDDWERAYSARKATQHAAPRKPLR